MPTRDLQNALRELRGRRSLSQLALAEQIGTSQRHISYVETGRAMPSRELLVVWLQAVDASLPTAAWAMAEAGYARTGGADGADVDASAVRALLDAVNPSPAFALDHDWNIVAANAGALWLLAAVTSGDDAPRNLLAEFSSPTGLGRALVNADRLVPGLMRELADEALRRPSLLPRIAALRERAETLGIRAQDSPQRPVGPDVLTPFGTLRFRSVFTTWGEPADVRPRSLRIEYLLPADPATSRTLRDHVPA